MTEKVNIKVPSHLASFVRPDAETEDKLRVVRDEVGATPLERVTLLFFLCFDKDREIKTAALSAMRRLPFSLVAEIVASPATHPRILDILAHLHAASVEISTLISSREDILPETAEYLSRQQLKYSATPVVADDASSAQVDDALDESRSAEPEEEEESSDKPVESKEVEEEEFKSKYQLAQMMGVGDKIKMALTGDKEWRSLLIKDTNKLVNGAVVKNPRITEAEVLTISKSVIQNDEIIRVICQNKDWLKNYEIKKALVLNHKTPLPVALRFMAVLTVKDLAAMAKSKNVATVLANQARRMMDSKKKS